MIRQCTSLYPSQTLASNDELELPSQSKVGPTSRECITLRFGVLTGGEGLRVGRDAKGRSYRSMSLPGTGLSKRTYGKTVASKGSGAYTSATQKNYVPTSPSVSGRAFGRVIAYGLAALVVYTVISYLLHLL